MTTPQDLVAMAARLGMGKVPQEALAAFAREVLAEQEAEVETLRRNLADAQKDNAGNAAEAAETDEALRSVLGRLTSSCVWCGMPSPEGLAPEALVQFIREHLDMCAQHPMRRLESRLEAVQQEASANLERAEKAEVRLQQAQEEHVKALVLARNEGLEKAATRAEERGFPHVAASILSLKEAES